ncbi:hypothetical protein LN457_00890, partial [Xanthomonas phaseoli]|nr:hypothetical protein [Xanthomonas phaseoli]
MISDAGAKGRTEDAVNPIDRKFGSEARRLDRDCGGEGHIKAFASLSGKRGGQFAFDGWESTFASVMPNAA